ncbi:MAG: OB-fold nucleic acid binding domain-containing protein [Thermoplasmata archaeon]
MNKNDLYDFVKDLVTRDRFELEIIERRKQYNDLLSDDAIAYMIVDEYGRNPGNWVKVKDLIDGVNVSLIVTITNIEETKIRKNDRDLRLRKIKVEDETGECILTLWNEELDNYNDLKIGEKIKIINCFVRSNNFGIQLSLGKWGVIIKI